MVRKKLLMSVCFFIGLLLVMQIVIAANTEVKIKTMPYREVQIAASKANIASFNLLQLLTGQADQYGDITFVFNFTDLKYNLKVSIKEEEITVASDKQLDLVTGDSLYLEVATSDFEFIETPNSDLEVDINNTTTNETSETNETTPAVLDGEETEEMGSNNFLGNMAGAVIVKVKNNQSTILYSVGGLIVIGGIILLLMRRREPRLISVTKLSDKIERESHRQAILDVESKLKQIQDELDGIK